MGCLLGGGLRLPQPFFWRGPVPPTALSSTFPVLSLLLPSLLSFLFLYSFPSGQQASSHPLCSSENTVETLLARSTTSSFFHCLPDCPAVLGPGPPCLPVTCIPHLYSECLLSLVSSTQTALSSLLQWFLPSIFKYPSLLHRNPSSFSSLLQHPNHCLGSTCLVSNASYPSCVLWSSVVWTPGPNHSKCS